MEKEQHYTEIVQANKDRIYRICCCYIQDMDERQDVYQNILIHIWDNLNNFQGNSQISTWIYRISVNTCLGFLRIEKQRKRYFVYTEETQTKVILNYPDISDADKKEKEIELLYQMIHQLSLFEKTLISLYLEDVNTKEISEIMGISESNVRVKIHRIKKILKEKMEEISYGSGQN